MTDRISIPDGNTNSSPDAIKTKRVIHATMQELTTMKSLVNAIAVSSGVRITGRISMSEKFYTLARCLQANGVGVLVIDEFQRAHFQRKQDVEMAIDFLRHFSRSSGIRVLLSKYPTPNQTSDVANRANLVYTKPWSR